jgi:hypothetical protein
LNLEKGDKMLTEFDWLAGYQAMRQENYTSMSTPISEDGNVCLGDFIFDHDSLTPEEEKTKYEKWDKLSVYAQETIRLLIEMPDYVKRIVLTPNGHLIRFDSGTRFFLLICGIIGLYDATCVFLEINEFMFDFDENDIPDFRIK